MALVPDDKKLAKLLEDAERQVPGVEASLQVFIEDEKVLLRLRENAVYGLIGYFTKLQNPAKIRVLLEYVLGNLTAIPKARLSKLLNTFLESLVEAGATRDEQEVACLECITWCREHNQIFLRQTLEYLYSTLLLLNGKTKEAIASLDSLIYDLKVQDTKKTLVEATLLMSLAQLAIKNIYKAKATLIVSRTTADSTYVQPSLQISIDLVSAIIAALFQEYNSTYSHGMEALENIKQTIEGTTSEQLRAMMSYAGDMCLALMLISRCLTGDFATATNLMENVKITRHCLGDIALAVHEVLVKARAEAYGEMMLVIDKAVEQISAPRQRIFASDLDRIILMKLHETIVDALKLIRSDTSERLLISRLTPYRRISLESCRKMLAGDEDMAITPEQTVETLCRLILDRKLSAAIDEFEGCLIVEDSLPYEYPTSLECDVVLDALEAKIGEASK